MKKKVVFSCSCFIDQSVWFINSISCARRFDEFVDIDDIISGDIFIFERKSSSSTSEIVVCCLECFEFLLTCVSMEDEFIDLLNKLDCCFLIEEPFCYNSLIYIGNDLQILKGANNDYRSTKDTLERYFKKFPNEKSCFTSLDKYSYESFCCSCKEIFKNFFLKKLFYFENKK